MTNVSPKHHITAMLLLYASKHKIRIEHKAMSNVLAKQSSKLERYSDAFKFYFKQDQKQKSSQPTSELSDLVRPRLKIALVTETWPPEINGVARSLLQLCKGLQKLGHKILLIRPEQKQACTQFQPYQECLVKAQAIPKYHNLQFGWPQWSKLSQALDEFQPDVVHIVTEGPLGLASLHIAKSKNIPAHFIC